MSSEEQIKTMSETVVSQQQQITDLVTLIREMPGVRNQIEVRIPPPHHQIKMKLELRKSKS